MLNVYLSGEIHTNWRDEIINKCKYEDLSNNSDLAHNFS